MKLTLKARSTSARCAYCHEGLQREALTCPDCATLLHEDCELDFCPTLGCASLRTWELVGALPSEVRRTAPIRRLRARSASPHPAWALLAGLLVASLALLVTRHDPRPAAKAATLNATRPSTIVRLARREGSLPGGGGGTEPTVLVSLELADSDQRR